MALTFEYEKDLSTGAQPFICHERDSTLYNYYVVDEAAKDTSALASMGHYDTVTFDNEDRSLTTKAVSKIGIKNFPGIGGIGFYRDAHSDSHLIVAPIHTDRDRYEAPTLSVAEILGDKLHLVVRPTANMNYNCYRIVVRQGAFAFEYVTYKTECFVDIPTVKGSYNVYCMGYDESTGVVSEDSNILTLMVTSGTDNWKPAIQDFADVVYRIDGVEQQLVALNEKLIEASGGTVSLVKHSYVYGSGNTSYTRSYEGTKGNMLLLLVLTRGTLTVPPAGWTLLGMLTEDKDKEIGSTTYAQYVHVFCKACDGAETFSYTQSESNMSITCILELNNATEPIIEEYTRQENVLDTTSLVFDRTSNDFFVWITNSIYFLNNTYVWQVSDSTVLQLPNNGTTQPRLGVFIDDREARNMFTVSSGMSGNRYCSGIGIRVPALSLQSQIDGLGLKINALEEEVAGATSLIDEINGVEV